MKESTIEIMKRINEGCKKAKETYEMCERIAFTAGDGKRGQKAKKRVIAAFQEMQLEKPRDISKFLQRIIGDIEVAKNTMKDLEHLAVDTKLTEEEDKILGMLNKAVGIDPKGNWIWIY